MVSTKNNGATQNVCVLCTAQGKLIRPCAVVHVDLLHLELWPEAGFCQQTASRAAEHRSP